MSCSRDFDSVSRLTDVIRAQSMSAVFQNPFHDRRRRWKPAYTTKLYAIVSAGRRTWETAVMKFLRRPRRQSIQSISPPVQQDVASLPEFRGCNMT